MHVRFRLPFAILSVVGFTREISREKRAASPTLPAVQSDLISRALLAVDFTAGHLLASRQLGASMDDPGAARRLREALDILASGELPECPVCKPPRAYNPSTYRHTNMHPHSASGLDIPVASDARILRCCAKIMCKLCIPSCNATCPFCRAPFEAAEAEDGESPYTYSTKDYSIHSHFRTTQEYSSSSYTATHDYSAHTAYSVTNDYSNTSSAYTASREYSSSADYSSITDKYCASSAGSSEPG